MTDAQIIDAIEISEGWPRYTNNKADLGGPTKGGITIATLRTWRHDQTVTAADVKALERPEARAIYQYLFLQPFAAIIDPALRYYLIDLGVLRGPRAAAQMLQDIVGVEADGWVGAETIAAMKPLANYLLVMLVGARFIHIAQRVRDVPSQQVFRDGWRHRNEAFLHLN